MDSRESAAVPLQHLQQPQPQQPPPQPQQVVAGGAPPPAGMMLGPPQPNSYMPNNTAAATANNNNASPMINPNSAVAAAAAMMQNPRFPFNPAAVVNSGSKPLDSVSYGDGSPGGFNIEPARKKRGRPRKYSNDGNGGGSGGIALGLTPTPVSSVVHSADSGGGTPSSDPPTKKNRGRPPGSGKKQLDALGAPGVGFTPHVITVKAGEDIASKIMAFSQQGPRTVCILSANGAVCNVTLRQPAMSGGTVSYEGRYEIISLSGSYILSENNGSRSRTGGLSVSLAGSDGRVLGGGVAGMLTAASPVQVIVGSFIADGKKPKSGLTSTPPPSMLNFSAPVVGASPPSKGPSSESSDDNGNSPLNHGPGSYINAGQPMPNMPVYNMGWGNSPIKMHPN